ncbi:MAG: NAD(P)H-dependent oxidoreductase [Muribaculaceae bacterium]|nr:NAD(P)H-dependent oxidoreductase [Muribaculaceae bacterium]
MRKVAFMLMAIAAITLAACTSKGTENQNTQQNNTQMKTLVTYFSASGVTKAVAERIARLAGADLMEIEPAQRYTDADLDWRDSLSRSSVEMKDKNSRPALAQAKLNAADYDVVYVGFPIWWYTAPTIINTFMEANDLKGKTVIPFATSGGSTIDKACQDLKAAYPDVNWKPGRLLNNVTDQEIQQWIDSNK